MALPDPNVPIQGKRFLVVAVIVGAAFTVTMAALTYGLAIGWAALHHSNSLPPQMKNGPTPTAPAQSSSSP